MATDRHVRVLRSRQISGPGVRNVKRTTRPQTKATGLTAVYTATPVALQEKAQHDHMDW
jgi:hypothetical protein